MRKIEIGNKLYSVAEMDEYTENKDVYTPKNTALIVGDKVVPIRSSIDSGPGVYYQEGAIAANIVKPSDDDTKYNIENMIDLSNPKDIGEVIEKNQLIRDIIFNAHFSMIPPPNIDVPKPVLPSHIKKGISYGVDLLRDDLLNLIEDEELKKIIKNRSQILKAASSNKLINLEKQKTKQKRVKEEGEVYSSLRVMNFVESLKSDRGCVAF